MRSTFSSDVLGRPEDFCFATLPVSLKCFSQQFRALSSGAFPPGCNLRQLRCTVTTDFNSAYLKTSSQTLRKHIRCPAMHICEPHRKHLLRHWFYFCIYSACCVRTEVIRLLPAYSLPRECVYRVIAYKWVYMSLYVLGTTAEYTGSEM
jgi:hypothetical protein